MIRFSKQIRKKVSYILSRTTLILDSSTVIDFHEQGIWYSFQESVPRLATTSTTVSEWKRNVPISYDERERVIAWGESFTVMPDSTSKVNLQKLPALELSCGVKVYPTEFLKGSTIYSISTEDNSQIWLAKSLEDSGEASALLSSNHKQIKKSPVPVWDYKFALSLLSVVGSVPAGDTRIKEMIKKDLEWDPSFNYQQYLTGDFSIKVDRIYKELKRKDK